MKKTCFNLGKKVLAMFLIVIMLVSYFPLNMVLANDENLSTNIINTNTIIEEQLQTNINVTDNKSDENLDNNTIQTNTVEEVTTNPVENLTESINNATNTMLENTTISENIEKQNTINETNTITESNTISENTINTNIVNITNNVSNTETNTITTNTVNTNAVTNNTTIENIVVTNNTVENTTVTNTIPNEIIKDEIEEIENQITYSDLSHFVTSVKLTNKDGNEITENIKRDENYKLKINFFEQINKQFSVNENGVMTYNLSENITLINNVQNIPLNIIGENGENIACKATISVNKDTNQVDVTWNKVDLLGNITDTYFFENTENANLSIELDVKIGENKTEEKIAIDFGNNVYLNISFLNIKNEEQINKIDKIEAKEDVEEIELKLSWQELLSYGPYITMVMQYCQEYGEQPSKEEVQIYNQYIELVYGKGSELAAIAMFSGTQSFTEEELAVYEAYQKIIVNGGEESPIQTLSIDIPKDDYNGSKVLSVRRTDGEFLRYLSNDGNPVNNSIKYIAKSNGEAPQVGTTRVAYCMNYEHSYKENAGYDENAWSDRIQNEKFATVYKKLYSELSYAVSIGCQYYGTHNQEKFSTGDNWEEDYYVTQTVIYLILDDYINNIDNILSIIGITLTDTEKAELLLQLEGNGTSKYPTLFSGHPYSDLGLNNDETTGLYGTDRQKAVRAAVDAMYNEILSHRAKTNGNNTGHDSSIVATPNLQTLRYQKDINGNEYYIGTADISTTGTMVSNGVTISGVPGITVMSFDGTTCTFKIPASSISNIEAGQAINITFSADFKDAKTVTYICSTSEKQSIAFFQNQNLAAIKQSTTVKVQKEETIKINGSKTWNDKADTSKRPNVITINLLADGIIKESKKITAKDEWKWSFTVPKKDETQTRDIIYTITENPVAGYNQVINGYNVTNTLITTQVNGLKNWSDHDNKHQTRPESITVNLLADNIKIDSKIVTSKNATNNNQWAYTFENLPKYNKDGSEIIYTVTENPVIGYDRTISGYNITNCLVTINISGMKTWVDFNNLHNKRPTYIKVVLYADGNKYDEKIVTADSKINNNQWAYTFENLPKYNKINGKEIAYQVKEEKTYGYEPSFTENNITNALITIDIKGQKVWEDYDNIYQTRPESIKINLLADGVKIDEKIVKAPEKVLEQISNTDLEIPQNNWEYEFNDLPKYNTDGTIINYTITENPIIGYIPEITDFNIKNTLETTEIQVIKKWNDTNNIDNTRPESIKIHLLADGKELKEEILTIENSTDINSWNYTFENLPKYNPITGDLVNYTITEDEVVGYSQYIEKHTIVNTLITTEVKGTKTWKDNTNAYQTRPESIIVNLFANGTKIREQIVTSNSSVDSNTWGYIFTNIPKYDKTTGEEIIYTVTENAIEKYKTQITEDGHSIINTLSEKTVVKGDKWWNDETNAFGLRPEYITVNLFANGEFYISQNIRPNMRGEWLYSFTNLEKYDENGVIIEYTITENPVDRYVTDIVGNRIINTLVQDHVDFVNTEHYNSGLDITPKTGRKNEIPFVITTAIISLAGIILLRKKEQI